MDHLRRGIQSLRGYAPKNPKQEFQRESLNLSKVCWKPMKGDVIGLCHVKVQSRKS